jgi:hypothetical protein
LLKYFVILIYYEADIIMFTACYNVKLCTLSSAKSVCGFRIVFRIEGIFSINISDPHNSEVVCVCSLQEHNYNI